MSDTCFKIFLKFILYRCLNVSNSMPFFNFKFAMMCSVINSEVDNGAEVRMNDGMIITVSFNIFYIMKFHY